MLESTCFRIKRLQISSLPFQLARNAVPMNITLPGNSDNEEADIKAEPGFQSSLLQGSSGVREQPYSTPVNACSYSEWILLPTLLVSIESLLKIELELESSFIHFTIRSQL